MGLLSLSLFMQNSLGCSPVQRSAEFGKGYKIVLNDWTERAGQALLISSSAQAGVGAQNAAQAAAQSSAGSSVTGATAPIAPVLSSPPVSNPSFSTTPNVVVPISPSLNSTPSEPQLRGLLRPSSTSPSTSTSTSSSSPSPSLSPAGSAVPNSYQMGSPLGVPTASPNASPTVPTPSKGNIESYFQLSGSRAAQSADFGAKPPDQLNEKSFPSDALFGTSWTMPECRCLVAIMNPMWIQGLRAIMLIRLYPI